MIVGGGGPGSIGKDYSLGGQGGSADGVRPISIDDLMTILEEDIVGDGQGCPDNDERYRAAVRILAEIERRQGRL